MSIPTEAPAAPDAYLQAGRLGRSSAGWSAAALAVIAFFWVVVGSAPVVGVVLLTGARSADQISPLPYFLAAMGNFACLLAGLGAAVAGVHGRPLRTLVRAAGPIRWRRLLLSGGVWLLISALTAGVEAALYPGRYTWAFDAGRFPLFAALIILLIPMQAATEELLFRGYLLQTAGRWTRSRLWLSGLSGLLFALPHLGNPEVSVNAGLLLAYYFAFGAFAAFITLQAQGLELALGLHIANNLFVGLFVNYPESALPTPALFHIGTLDPVYGLASTLIGLALFYWLVRPAG